MSTKVDYTSNNGYGHLLMATVLIAFVGAIVAGVYLSGAGDDIVKWVAEKYFKAEAKAEEKVLEKKAGGEVEDLAKQRLKNNPVVGNDELNKVSAGLGDEASKAGVSKGLAGLKKKEL